MSKDYEPRLFRDDAAVRHIGEGLLGRTLSREWTHEAHLAACLWIIAERPDIVPECDLPDIIRGFNESVGGVNDDTQGYHETITQSYIRGVRLYLERTSETSLAESVNGLLQAPEGSRDWPLRFFSSERLFSVPARRGWIEPDLAPLPQVRARRI